MSKLPRATEKRFLESNILTMKATLEKRYRLNLQLKSLNEYQVFLMCEDYNITKCTFIYFFRKVGSFSNQDQYALLFSSSEHSPQCNQKRKTIQLPIEFKTPQKGSRRSLNLDSKQQQELDCLQQQFCQFDHKHNPQSHEQRQKKENQNSFYHFEQKIKQQHQPEYYRQCNYVYNSEQLPILKKTLVHRYKALVSKSTYLDPILNVVTKISFRCKNAQKSNCSFLQVLNLVPESQASPLYQLESVNCQHTSDCIMDFQDLRYHEMTKKIDDSLEIIQNIVQKLGQIKGDCIRPKQVLDMLAQELGQENGDFIYQGLQRRNNRRAVKKYFDNAVGKIRNRQGFNYAYKG